MQNGKHKKTQAHVRWLVGWKSKQLTTTQKFTIRKSDSLELTAVFSFGFTKEFCEFFRWLYFLLQLCSSAHHTFYFRAMLQQIRSNCIRLHSIQTSHFIVMTRRTVSVCRQSALCVWKSNRTFVSIFYWCDC